MPRWVIASCRRFTALRWSVDLELSHQEQVEQAEAFIILVNDNRPPRRGVREEVRVPNEKRAAITHVDGERPKRLRAVDVSKLLHGHVRMIPPTPIA